MPSVFCNIDLFLLAILPECQEWYFLESTTPVKNKWQNDNIGRVAIVTERVKFGSSQSHKAVRNENHTADQVGDNGHVT